MSNRGYLFLSILLALAGKPALAERPVVTVQVYDYTGLKPKALHEVASLTQEILVHTGLSVEVLPCQKNLPPCRSEAASPRQLIVRIVSREPAIITNIRRPPLGEAFAGVDGGIFASVFLLRVQEAADHVDVPWLTVLSYATAHEVGHLLLGKDSHTISGLMKANWDRRDLQAMNQHYLFFTEEQARQLAAHYGVAGQTVADANTPSGSK